MNQEFKAEHALDDDGNPAGGWSSATGIDINWQDGPLGRGDERKEPNGAFTEILVNMVIDRLRFYQEGKFFCRENSLAITKLEEAAHWMNARTASRELHGVEGTHEQRPGEPSVTLRYAGSEVNNNAD